MSWQNIACEILDIAYTCDIPQGLFDRLDTVDNVCRKAGGRLHSRQLIASIIEQWNRENA